jgi:hypothetical protein
MALVVVLLVVVYVALVFVVIRSQRRRLRARREDSIDLTGSDVPIRLDDARVSKRRPRHFTSHDEV